jgi:6-phosphogluconolactonase
MKLLWLFTCLLTPTVIAAEYDVYFGTYTKGKSTSKGIYVSRFNNETGACTEPTLAAEVSNPSFLAVHPDHRFIYSVGEISIPGFKGGGVCAWQRDATTGKLTAVGKVQDSLGAGPCHINLDPTGRCAVVANYAGGSIVSYKVNADGSLSEAVSFIQHTGSSVNPNRQKEPHAHSANFSADGKHVLVTDLGTDEIISYEVDAATARLTAKHKVQVPAGSGPRHLSFHPTGKVAFTNGEMLLNVTSMNYDAAAGSLKLIETMNCLPADIPFNIKHSTAEILVHPNGKFIYVSVRGHDSISRLSYNASTQKMQYLGNTPSGGKIPRNFTLDPSGRWLFAAHQITPQVVIFAIHPDTGELNPTSKELAVNACVCVRFVPLNK